MNDPLKKFVQENREAFDHLVPPTDVLQRLKTQLVPPPVVKKPFMQRHGKAIWLVAASSLVGIVCTYVLLSRPDMPQGGGAEPRIAQQADTEVVAPRPAKGMPSAADSSLSNEPSPQVAIAQRPQPSPSKKAVRPASAQPHTPPLFSRLADSTSASIRLAAILEIEQSNKLDDHTLTKLFSTMNHDANTNVRLAALDVLSRQLHRPQVADRFADALAVQSDPVVQLGLVKIAAQLNHVAVEEALFALARSPYTFSAVKDEAYAILLNQDKL